MADVQQVSTPQQVGGGVDGIDSPEGGQSLRLSRSDATTSPAVMPNSYVSIDSFLDSVSTSLTGGAVAGSPPVRPSAHQMVKALELDAGEEGSSFGSDMAAPLLFLPDMEPEPEPESEPNSAELGVIIAPPPLGLLTQSRAAALARSKSPARSVLSSSDGSDDSGGKPEAGGAVFDVLHEGKPISLSVGAMGIQLFDGKKFIASFLYENMDGWTFDVGDEPISPSRSRAVGVVRIFLERFSDEQVTEMQANGVWKAGGPTLKVFGVLSQRVGKYITMQIDARFGKMMRDREAELLHEEEQAAFGWPQVDDGGAGGDGAAGGGVALLDEEDPEPSPLYVACEQHASGLLTRFLADSVQQAAAAAATALDSPRVEFPQSTPMHGSLVEPVGGGGAAADHGRGGGGAGPGGDFSC